MYNNPYLNPYNQQMSIDKLNEQINNLEKMKSQIQQPVQQPSINQTFQLTPSQSNIKYANNIEDVNKELVFYDTPFFTRDLSQMWLKNAKGEIKVFELNEIVPKDDKDIRIEFLEAQIKELKEGMKNNAKSDSTDVDGAIESEEPTSISNSRKSNAKSK